MITCLALQAASIEAATTSLLDGLQSLAGRLAALSGPIADTGVSAQPLSAVPLLGSMDEDVCGFTLGADIVREAASGGRHPHHRERPHRGLTALWA